MNLEPSNRKKYTPGKTPLNRKQDTHTSKAIDNAIQYAFEVVNDLKNSITKK